MISTSGLRTSIHHHLWIAATTAALLLALFASLYTSFTYMLRKMLKIQNYKMQIIKVRNNRVDLERAERRSPNFVACRQDPNRSLATTPGLTPVVLFPKSNYRYIPPAQKEFVCPRVFRLSFTNYNQQLHCATDHSSFDHGGEHVDKWSVWFCFENGSSKSVSPPPSVPNVPYDWVLWLRGVCHSVIWLNSSEYPKSEYRISICTAWKLKHGPHIECMTAEISYTFEPDIPRAGPLQVLRCALIVLCD